jgi:hypothetical protein
VEHRRYYRQKAAEARRAAKGVTTRAIKARLADMVRDFDGLADAADRAARQQTCLPVSLSTEMEPHLNLI